MRLKFPGNKQDKANDSPNSNDLFSQENVDTKTTLPYLSHKQEIKSQMERKINQSS